jgi:hypothetical protein
MSAQVTILQLPPAGAITGTEAVPIVQNGVTVQTTTAALAGSPVQTYTYLTVSQTPQLANSRYVGATNGLTITDGGAQGLFNISTTGALLSLVNAGTGFQVKTSATAITPRSIAVSGNGLSIADGSGVSGDPTISLTGQTLNFANASFNGLVALSTAGAITSAIINTAGTVNGLTLTGGPLTPTSTITLGGTLDLSSPPAIGGTAPAAGAFTTLSASSGLTTRVVIVADATSITVNADTTDIAIQANTQAVGSLTINAPTGTIVNGQKFILRLRSTNVQTFAWNAVFQGSTDIALPNASSGANLYDYVGFIYNSAASKWQMIAKVFGF